MATNLELETRIQAYDWAMLRDFWQEIKDKNTVNLNPKWESGKAFEYFIIRCFELSGVEVVYPFSVRNKDAFPKYEGQNTEYEQLDGIIYINQYLAFIVECKNEAEENFDDIAKLHTRMQKRPSLTMGCFIHTLNKKEIFKTNSITQTKELYPRNILLWGRTDINWLFAEPNFSLGAIAPVQNLGYILSEKYKFLVKTANPCYYLTLI